MQNIVILLILSVLILLQLPLLSSENPHPTGSIGRVPLPQVPWLTLLGSSKTLSDLNLDSISAQILAHPFMYSIGAAYSAHC